MIHVIRELIESEELCEYQSSVVDELSFFGTFTGVSDTVYVLRSVDPMGRSAGFEVGWVENLSIIRRKTGYLRQLARKIELSAEPPMDTSWEPAWDGVFGCLQATRELITVYPSDSGRFFLQVLGFRDEILTGTTINDRGEADGDAFVRLECIERIEFRGPRELTEKFVLV
jgi:hypothetical protein